MFDQNQSKFNKGIFTLIGILIVLIFAVLAGGCLYWHISKEKVEISEVKIQEKIETPATEKSEETTTDETPNWKIYQNEKHGFEVRYPEKCSVELLNQESEFYPFAPNPEKIKRIELIEFVNCNTFIDVYANPNNLSIEQWNEAYRRLHETGSGLGFLKPVFVNNISGIKGMFGCCTLWNKAMAISKNGKIILIHTKNPLDIISEKDKVDLWIKGEGVEGDDVFNQILSTFKFTKTTNVREIQLFYYNSIKDKEIAEYMPCSTDAVLPVKKTIPVTKTPIQDAIKLLLEGKLTTEEKSKGFETEFPHPEFKLLETKLKDGILTLKFTEAPGFTTGGSCRIGILAAQIEKTAKQFFDVKEVKFEPDEIFQP